MKKLCVICGKEFESKLASKTCSPEHKEILKKITRKKCKLRYRQGISATKKNKDTNPGEIRRIINTFTGKLDTLCWHCQNACGGCSWSKNLTPVEGWKAEKIKLKVDKGNYNDSYIVNECPKFKPDAKRKKKEV